MSQNELDDLPGPSICWSGAAGCAPDGRVRRKSEAIGRAAPRARRKLIVKASEGALRAALHAAVRSLKRKPSQIAAIGLHQGGGRRLRCARGAFGLQLVRRIAVSTTILLRSSPTSRARRARTCRGRNPRSPAQGICAGRTSQGRIRRRGGYFAVRTALAQSVSESARFLLHGAAGEAGRAGATARASRGAVGLSSARRRRQAVRC